MGPAVQTSLHCPHDPGEMTGDFPASQPLLSSAASDLLFPLIWENGYWLRVSADFPVIYITFHIISWRSSIKLLSYQGQSFKNSTMTEAGVPLDAGCLCFPPSTLKGLGCYSRAPVNSVSHKWILNMTGVSGSERSQDMEPRKKRETIN